MATGTSCRARHGHCGAATVRASFSWTRHLKLALDYKPDSASKRLDSRVSVFNQQKALFINDFDETTRNPNRDYGRINHTQAPRFARFAVADGF